MILRFLNPQGIAGLAASLCLGLLLILQKGETRYWAKQAGQSDQLYREAEAAHAATVASYRAAAEQARAADRANVERVAAEQRSINKRTEYEFEARLAAARVAAGRLRAGTAPVDPGSRRDAPVPELSATPAGPSASSGPDRLSVAERLLATEQAIQLEELIDWVKAQAAVNQNQPESGR